jgi:Cdc6-like AAA superfamily ATPase
LLTFAVMATFVQKGHPLRRLLHDAPPLCEDYLKQAASIVSAAAEAMGKQHKPQLVAARLSSDNKVVSAQHEQHFVTVCNAVTQAIAAGAGTSVYVQGPSGSGVTTLLTQLQSTVDQTCDHNGYLRPIWCYVDTLQLVGTCTVSAAILAGVEAYADIPDIYEWEPPSSILEQGELFTEIETLLYRGNDHMPMIVLMLDDLDNLDPPCNDESQQLFMWADHHTKFRLILICAGHHELAQAVPDLPELDQEPVEVQLSSYSANDMKAILTASVGTAVPAEALDLCVAKAEGDMWEGFSVCVRAVEIAMHDHNNIDQVTVAHMEQAIAAHTIQTTSIDVGSDSDSDDGNDTDGSDDNNKDV